MPQQMTFRKIANQEDPDKLAGTQEGGVEPKSKGKKGFEQAWCLPNPQLQHATEAENRGYKALVTVFC